MVVGESKRTANIMDGIENTGDVRLHDHRLRLKQRFDIVRKLGQGTYGKVQLGINKKTGQEVAIKTIKKCKIETEADLIRIRREVQIMSSVRHPNIVHIYEVFENSEKMILVMEYCSGGELYDYLSQKKVLEEDEARRLFRQIATAVYYCHIHKICHRDLKLENVLLDDTGSAKIADFGLSNVFKETSLLSTFCGSPLYASPEIVKGTPYIGPEVDCWSLGVLLYTLVYGAMPFDGSNFKRLVRQISNGDYYEPKNPSTASPLIRDMLTVDPLKRADIAYICDHPWVNTGCEASCLEVAEALAAETPVRLDLLLSLAPAASSCSNSVLVPPQTDLGPEESCTDLTSSTSMAVEPSNSAEKRILELVAEGGEDAIKPSPTRTLVAAADNKRKLDAAASASCLRKKERVASCASMAPLSPALPEEDAKSDSPPPEQVPEDSIQLTQPALKCSATMTISPAPLKEQPEVEESVPYDEHKDKPTLVIKKKVSPPKSDEKSEKLEETKDTTKSSAVSSAADKLTSLSLAQPTPAPAPAPAKPKKLSIPGGHVGSFKEQFERRASLTAAPEIKRNITKPVVSKIAKPKAQSEDRELSSKAPDSGTVRLQQIGIEPSPTAQAAQASERAESRGGVKKTESEPTHGSAPVDPSALLQDARRSLQNSMAKLAEERAGEDSRRRAARDIISSAIRTGKPPVPYGRSSSAGVATLLSPPGTPGAPGTPGTPGASVSPAQAPRVFRTEALHRVDDHRNRGVSVERIIPITMTGEEPTPTSTSPATPVASPPASLASPVSPVSPAGSRVTPLRRLTSVESTGEAASPSTGEPIKKSAREFIIPIAVEGKGYVTPRQRSLEPDALPARLARAAPRPRRISSLVSGGESEEEDDTHMHRLRSTRAARAESVSSGEEDEEDEGFHLLTAENLFSTLLHRVRALTQRLNGEEGPGFQHPHSLFNNLQSPFFNSPHLPRRNLFTHRYMESKRSISETREGWGSRDLHAPFDSMFGKRPAAPRGSSKKTAKHQTRASPNSEANAPDGLDLSDLDLSSIEFSEREMQALSGLTPALSRRLQRQLLAHLPPRAAARLRRTLSLHATPPAPGPAAAAAAARPPYGRSQSASKALETRCPDDSGDLKPEEPRVGPDDPPIDGENLSKKSIDEPPERPSEPLAFEKSKLDDDTDDLSASQFCTLPRLRRRKTQSKEPESASKILSLIEDSDSSKIENVRRIKERPLLSKYLAPEKHNSLDETTYLSEGSILSEPSYIAAYGSPAVLNTPVSSFRRHSLRLSGDQSKKRISRFLRSDFFDTPPDESLYAKHKKEKELETQKILKEIREKKNKSLNTTAKSPIETNDFQFTSKEENSRKCLSPVTNTILKDRSRSNTPFFPILDNIKETNLDSSLILLQTKEPKEDNEMKSKPNNMYLDSKLSRPKSYPIKNVEKYDNATTNVMTDSCRNGDNEVEDKKAGRESKLIRPKSYPTSNTSPEKVYMNRNNTKEEIKSSKETNSLENKTDVEVSFSITLPKKLKSVETESQSKQGPVSSKLENKVDSDSTLTLKKYKVINSKGKNEKVESSELQVNNNNDELKNAKNGIIKDDVKPILTENQTNNKKGVIKKKIVKKVSSKSKTDLNVLDANESKSSGDKKKVIKKVKEKDKIIDDNTPSVPKKKSVLQSIGHKLEKLASSKSNSPEKVSNCSIPLNDKNDDSTFKQNRNQREHSVPANIEAVSESNLIKRAVTITDVAALENQNSDNNKTTVSKVLGLFKRFEPKEKNTKANIEKNSKENININNECLSKKESICSNNSEDKPKRPNSLLLNGLGRKNKYNRSSSEDDPVINIENSERQVLKKENDSKPTLKLDFSRLPRVKKIVPTNPVIEPQIMTFSNVEKYVDKNDILEKNGTSLDIENKDSSDTMKRSRSRSRSIYSNSDIKSEVSPDFKDKHPLNDSSLHQSIRNHESISPEKEDIVDRIRRKSFYSRFNEKKQRRKSSLVGPGATEYDPLARIHSHVTESKYDMSPTSPGSYDLSPGLSVGSDLSPSTERYRSLLNDLPITTRSNLKYDGINDKIDMYRSLDRKYSGTRSYLDYDQPSSYNPNRYSRTKSLFDGTDQTEDQSYGFPRESHKYSRTNSLFAPGSYATYRPKRTRNSAIILKESEKEPSPENILDKIRQRKISISVTRKPDHEKESVPRSNVTSKSEGDGSERSAKID
ncbi:unnamed protein product [Euphydryas editha]|uniref:Protein kinase domain-containing protein n=1 Tax=Euphydryas editha TaxID=104508 RepID=A0AAU9VBQ5_EUPED|nr:unnamed protein product [Euphydryas editha]